MSGYKLDRSLRVLDDDLFDRLQKRRYEMRNMRYLTQQTYKYNPTDATHRYMNFWHEELDFWDELYDYNIQERKILQENRQAIITGV